MAESGLLREGGGEDDEDADEDFDLDALAQAVMDGDFEDESVDEASSEAKSAELMLPDFMKDRGSENISQEISPSEAG